MSLSLSEIRAFNATLKCGNFSRAAVELDVSQPAITAQIRKLEARFDQPLLERFSTGVRPTDFGQRLHRITSQYDDLDGAIRSLAQPCENQGRYQLRIATSSPQVFMPLIAGFSRRYPEATLTINSSTTDDCQSLVLNREADIGLFPMPDDEPGITRLSFHTHRLEAIIPEDHPLSTLEQVSVHQLIEYPLVFRKKGCCTQGLVDKVFASANLQPSVQVCMDARSDMCEAVAHGLGIGFALSNDIRPDGDYRMVPIVEAVDNVEEHMVWLKARTEYPGIRDFIQLAMEMRCTTLPATRIDTTPLRKSNLS
ncbi:MAG: LysR family transcriptional regulator [Chromatiales bacterium]|nr:LysR family transcriptional regulator [Chromatiales bacterium]